MTMKLVTLDFESYYDSKDYSLSKMTTEQYINDPRFQAIGVSVAIDDGKARWANARDEDLRRMLRADDKELWSNTMLLAHNAKFDAAILAKKFGIYPKMILDTLSMARALHPTGRHSLAALAERYGVGVKGTEVGDANGKRLEDFTDEELAQYGLYCCNDVLLTRDIFYRMMEDFPKSELEVVDLSVRMYTDPVLRLDRKLVQLELDTEVQRKAELIERSQADGGEVFRSNEKFANLLIGLGVEPPTKLSPKQKNPDGTAKRVWAFAKNDADFIALQNHDDETVVAAVEARLGCKSTQRETRAQRFLGIHDRNDGVLPVPLAYYSAHTGRYGGDEKINLQNLQRTNKKDKSKGLLRQAIIAPPGHSLVVADLSQIEARLLVYQANQTDKVEAFAQKRDVYSEQASVIYGRHVDRKAVPEDFEAGFVGKATILGCGFGLGFGKFASSMYAGFLGGAGITFGDDYVDTLGVDVDGFVSWIENPRRQEQMLRIKESKPMLLDERDWMKHVAVSQNIIKTYRGSNEKVVEYWDIANDALTAMLHGEEMEFGGPENNMLRTGKDCIWLPNGMRLQYEDLKCEKGEWSFLRKKEGRVQRVKTYGGSVVENVTQALARIVITNVMRRCDRMGIKVALQVHDEVVLVVPDNIAEMTYKWVIKQMQRAPKWAPGLPLDAEGGFGFSYGGIK